MYSLFRDQPNEQQLYQAIASVGNVLLSLGEFGNESERQTQLTSSLLLSKEQDLKSNSSSSIPAFTMNDHLEEKDPGPSKKSKGMLEMQPVLPAFNNPVMINEDVSIASELESSILVKEALADAARSLESSIGTPGHSNNGEDFVYVGSDDAFSSPEPVDVDRSAVDWNTLELVCSKLDEEQVLQSESKTVSCGQTADDALVNVKQTTYMPSTSLGELGMNNTSLKHILSTESGGCGIVPRLSSERVAEVDSSLGSHHEDHTNSHHHRASSSGALDLDWAISFEQFLASMLTEPYLVHFFEEEVDIQERLKRMKTEGVGSLLKRT